MLVAPAVPEHHDRLEVRLRIGTAASRVQFAAAVMLTSMK